MDLFGFRFDKKFAWTEKRFFDLACISDRVGGFMFKIFDLLNGALITREYAQEAMSQGVTAIHVTVNNFSTIRPYPSLKEAVSELAAIRAHYASLADVTHVIERYEDFARATDSGKLGIVLGYQNVPGIGTDLTMLELFHALGVRVIQIAHNNRGLYADGCAESSNGGLSGLGRELIKEMNRLGIVVDLSHTGDRSSLEAIALSSQPACVTHANAYAVCKNVRNKSDAVIDALKAKDGVIGVCYLAPLVRMGADKLGQSDVIAHIDHIRKRIGAQHIGLGSDFIHGQPAERYQEFMRRPEVYGTWPWRFPVADLADQQTFLASLRSIGLSDAEIAGIAGENFLRLFSKVLH
jgi:membrane dipeptidase